LATAIPSGENLGRLVKDRRPVRLTAAFAVFQNEDAIAFLAAERPVLQLVTIVDRFADPDTAEMIDVDAGRVGKQRLGGPELHFQPGDTLKVPSDCVGVSWACADGTTQMQKHETTRDSDALLDVAPSRMAVESATRPGCSIDRLFRRSLLHFNSSIEFGIASGRPATPGWDKPSGGEIPRDDDI